MKPRHVVIAMLVFAIGVVSGFAAKNIGPSAYKTKSKKEAAMALLEHARGQAGKGSWERIAVGRVYYLGGMKKEGQEIFDEVLSRKPEWSDKFRIARVYAEAKEWSKAKPIFDDYVKANPKDDKGLAEIGAYYLLHGDRETAEELFERSFKLESELWSTVNAAASYLGVPPQQ
jgi:tetratricopeptide (TPR) repeat protein